MFNDGSKTVLDLILNIYHFLNNYLKVERKATTELAENGNKYVKMNYTIYTIKLIFKQWKQ